MKIRIKGNSLRVRLTRSELDIFGREGYLEERTEFGNATLIYALQISDSLQNLSADYYGNKITLFVPKSLTDKWVSTDMVGFSNKLSIGESKELFLLVEKDFKCIDGEVLEDQSDNFDNPLDKCE